MLKKRNFVFYYLFRSHQSLYLVIFESFQKQGLGRFFLFLSFFYFHNFLPSQKAVVIGCPQTELANGNQTRPTPEPLNLFYAGCVFMEWRLENRFIFFFSFPHREILVTWLFHFPEQCLTECQRHHLKLKKEKKESLCTSVSFWTTAFHVWNRLWTESSFLFTE